MSAVGGQSGGPARRAVVRWAWRLFRREWRQQLLVLTLVTVAIAAALSGSALAFAAAGSDAGRFGHAGASAQVEGSDSAAARRALAGLQRRFGQVEVIPHTAVEVPGSADRVDLRAQDPHAALGGPMLALREGRYPKTAGEVALTPQVAALLSAEVGKTIELGGTRRHVVGVVENPGDLDDAFALLAPKVATGPVDTYTVLIADPDAPVPGTGGTGSGGRTDQTGRSGSSGTDQVVAISRAGHDDGPVTAIVLIMTTLAMALVGLVAAAGFVVVAQRRQRQLGLLSAIGATGRHLRLVTVANGAIVGVVAAVVGSVLGAVVWTIATPAVETASGHRIGRLDLPWGTLAEVLAVGVAMSVAAAWWPARTMARLPVMTALSGRPSRPLPVHRSLALALVLIVAGAAGLAVANPAKVEPSPLPLIGGIVAVVLGMVFVAPATVRGLARPAGRLPFAPRLALRDLARYQARAAAALAAITLGLGISVMVVAVAAANEYRGDEGNLSDRQMLILASTRDRTPDPDLSATALRRLDGQAAAVASHLGDDPTRLALDVAMPTHADPGAPHEPVRVGQDIDEHTIRDFGPAYVATPELLAHFHIDPAAIPADVDLLTGSHKHLRLLDVSSRTSVEGDGGKALHVDGFSAYTASPDSLVTEAAMQRHGWRRARFGWFAEAPRALTSDRIAAARKAAAAAGMTIDVRSSQDDLAQLRTGATAGGALLALALVAMTIGLIRGESARDLQTLTATGAAARTRRALTASTAGALALLGVVLGTGGAYVALVAGYRSRLDQLVPLPVTQLAALLVGVPAIAVAAGWLLAGREPRGFARQALE